LTAAHCICFYHDTCNKGVPEYDPKKKFRVYLGLNSKKVSFDMWEMKGTKNEYGVARALAYQKYDHSKVYKNVFCINFKKIVK